MSRRIAVLVVVMVAAVAACRRAREGSPPASSAPVAQSAEARAAAGQPAAGQPPPVQPSPGQAAPGQPSPAASSGAPAPGSSVPAPHTGNLVALEMGGHVERGKGLALAYETFRLLDDDPKTSWSSEMDARLPHEIVLSFLGRDSAMVAGVTLTVPPIGVNSSAGICPDDTSLWPQDVEIWTSMENPNDGFRKIAAVTLPKASGDHAVPFPSPVDARYVKLVITSNHGCGRFTLLADVSVAEAHAPGYLPLLTRHADLAARLSSGGPPADRPSSPPAPQALTGDDPCAASSVPPAAPGHPESHNVLIIAGDAERYAPYYYTKVDPESPKVRYFPSGSGDGRVDSSVLRRASFLALRPEAVNAATFVPSAGIDTTVVAQVCDIKTSLSPAAKRAIVNWVADGHKLIIQDSDVCSGGPDYSFLPFPFATNNPGAKAAASRLTIVENNLIVSARSTDPSYLDEESWRLEKNGNGKNDLGDSNTVVRFDSHWCGALTGTNANGASGFVLAYAHYGRGVMLYDGLDYDQRRSVAYRQYVLRQLLLPFGPDGLACSVPLAPFMITTDGSLVSRPLSPGETAYPITVASNAGAFQGVVRLSFVPPPSLRGLVGRFDPATVTLGNEAKSTLTLTLPAPLPDAWRMAVRGDTPDAHATLCLAANLRKTGHLTVSSDLGPQAASRKNLLIVLDLSGSMNQPLGKSTRIATARQVLRDVLKRIPDEFNVGLRVYGHRYGSRQKETCNDSELVVPVRKLDRDAMLKAIDRFRPRGETPLVYSILQATDDLKSAGGGSVVAITDGEESCGGDFTAAASTIRQAGVGVRLNIVGFTLTGAEAQRQLGTLSSSTGGAYYAAQDGPTLARALVAATISRFSYSVVDASGAVVATGEAGDAGQELAPGEYKVIVQAGDDKLALDRIAVNAGSSAAVRVVRKGDRFALDR